MAAFTQANYNRLAQIAKELHAFFDNDGYQVDAIEELAKEIMQMVEACIGQQEGPRWWQP